MVALRPRAAVEVGRWRRSGSSDSGTSACRSPSRSPRRAATSSALDVDQGKVAALREGRSHIEDIPDERLAARARALHVHDPLRRAARDRRDPRLRPDAADAATASRTSGRCCGAAQALAGVIRRGQTVILESTTFPGTTREHLVPLLEESGLRAGEDFALAFSPERVDPGRTDYTLRNTPKVVGGYTPACTEAAVAVYAPVCDEIVRVSTPEVAELSKLLENIFRSVNIALVNEMAMLADRMGIDIWEVVDAAATKPYGFMPFEPGPGHGRPLPAGRPVLPDLEGARVRPLDRVHRARRQGQPADAVLLPGEGRAGAERRRQAGQGLADPDRRRLLQGAASATCASHRR